ITVRGRRIHPRDVFVTLLPRTLSMDEVESKIADGTLMEEQECIVVEALGDKAGRRIKYHGYVVMTLQEANKLMSGATALSYLVGTPAAIAVEMFGRKEIETNGVVAPEGLKKRERDSLLKYLVKKGVKIREETQALYKFRIGSFEKILIEEV
ncbi:MAG: saccharopine dehydrogenase C-terminal domain-containing protein, partial [Candidatus Bathycorpusculaceae bacterium]